MLGGNSPVMVFNFASISSASILNKLGFNIGEDSIFNFNVPIVSLPVYLDERLTGIVADDHERDINIEFETDGFNNYERVISSDVKIVLKARKDNRMFQAFLALFEQIVKKIPYKAYKIYFYYDDVFLTNAGLKDFAVTTGENTDTRIVTFTLTNRSEKSQTIERFLSDLSDSLGVPPNAS